jgi:ubiquinone/menaquinone biosynthesis C-methylase UbiE
MNTSPDANKSGSTPQGQTDAIATALQELLRALKPQRVLDVGCGSGRWLAVMQPLVPMLCGVDLSLNMLQCVPRAGDRPDLVCGNAERRLPYQKGAFDLIVTVNALPNFGPVESFFLEVRRLLRPGGVVAIIGTSSDERRDSASLYNTFGGIKNSATRQFPSWGVVTNTLVSTGYDRVELRILQRVASSRVDRKVLGDVLAYRTDSVVGMLAGWAPL